MADITTKKAGSIIINTVSGKIHLDDVKEFLQENVESWVEKPILLNLSKMDFQHIYSDNLREFVFNTSPALKKRGAGKTAIVAPHDVQYGMMRAYQTLAENASVPIRYKVFRGIPEAKNWLLEKTRETRSKD